MNFLTGFLREHTGKSSMARLCALLLIPAVYAAVWRSCDWKVVSALVAGGIVSLVTRSRKDAPHAEEGPEKH